MAKIEKIEGIIRNYQSLMEESAREVREDVKRLQDYTNNQHDNLAYMFEVESTIKSMQNSIGCYKSMRTRLNELLNVKNMLENG